MFKKYHLVPIALLLTLLSSFNLYSQTLPKIISDKIIMQKNYLPILVWIKNTSP